ncbi:MAG: cell division protein ZapA [Desulfovibrio sp.]
MSRFNLTLLGLELTFKADASKERVARAQELVEERARDLKRDGNEISKERLLTFLVLTLADDYLEVQDKLENLEKRLANLLEKTP